MKSFAIALAMALFSLIVPNIAGPVGNPNNWIEQPTDLTDLSQFPDHLFQVGGRPVPADVVKAYGLEFSPNNTTGVSIFEGDVEGAQWTTKCETSEASPVSWHLEVAINWLRQRGQTQCLQWLNGRPYCTELIGFLSVRIGLCAEYHYWLWCESAAGFTRAIFEQCRNWLGGDDRAGGFTIIRGWPGQDGFRGMIVYSG
ncbi:hypothetical protein L873DRAFT_1809427 [Choiromyces venosus 120613-1]|uniref:Ecp2 effector protein domain-containing protein n=1 Tax=Choiromyces venosus 120613-1 TaxID=1336337 RepID=A0A3N4JLK9_9PEZI|nr:hypothetical protein L873DRAFT_1809427 [Choiromyces venosus 120613-1]